jgi:LacI family transcriptional regulator
MAVSAVLNGSQASIRVSDSTRVRILEAANRLQYRPNAVARGLTRRRMNTVGLVAEVHYPSDINLIIHELLNGALEAAALWNQYLIVCPIQEWSSGTQKILDLCDGRLDGLILIGPSLSDEQSEQLYRYTEYVSLYSTGPPHHGVNLEADNVGGAYSIVNYLISLGHRRIAHFAGPANIAGSSERELGYRRALEDAGIVYDPSIVIPGPFDVASGRETARRLLDDENPSPKPSAVFCANDGIASGATQVLHDRGIRVPEQISVAGFDDSLVAQMTVRRLTTVRQPLRAMGYAALELLLEQIDLNQSERGRSVLGRQAGQTAKCLVDSGAVVSVSPTKTLTFRTELVIRDSAGPPPNK